MSAASEQLEKIEMHHAATCEDYLATITNGPEALFTSHDVDFRTLIRHAFLAGVVSEMSNPFPLIQPTTNP